MRWDWAQNHMVEERASYDTAMLVSRDSLEEFYFGRMYPWSYSFNRYPPFINMVKDSHKNQTEESLAFLQTSPVLKIKCWCFIITVPVPAILTSNSYIYNVAKTITKEKRWLLLRAKLFLALSCYHSTKLKYSGGGGRRRVTYTGYLLNIPKEHLIDKQRFSHQ